MKELVIADVLTDHQIASSVVALDFIPMMNLGTFRHIPT
jgi:hypothetical protein